MVQYNGASHKVHKPEGRIFEPAIAGSLWYGDALFQVTNSRPYVVVEGLVLGGSTLLRRFFVSTHVIDRVQDCSHRWAAGGAEEDPVAVRQKIETRSWHSR